MAPKNERLLKDLAEKFRKSLIKEPEAKPVSMKDISNLKQILKTKRNIWNYLHKKEN